MDTAMSNVTVNISFQGNLLRDIDKIARKEDRSRSELVREAVRAYIQKRKRWDDIFALGKRVAKEGNLKPEDVFTEIAEYRKTKAKGI